MPVNIASHPFELIIAGIDRSAVMDVINLFQPSTLEAGDAPITGKITLKFSSRDRNDYTYTTNPTIAARFAVGALVTYRITDDSGDLVYHHLSGQQLFILKKPSPPVGNTLTLQVGCILAYQDQRTADFDPSGVTIGTDTPRNTVIERILKAAGITDYSVPSLPYPFNCPAEKSGGSLVKMAAAIAKAAKHVMYCNSAGTVIVAPIDLDASPVTTLTIGSDEVSFEPVDGSAIPDVTELTISGVCQVPANGNYPILSLTEKYINYRTSNFSVTFRVLTNKGTEEIQSENYSASFNEIHYFEIAFDPLQGIAVLNEGEYFIINLEERFTEFDSANRLSKTIYKKYLRLSLIVNSVVSFLTPFLEIKRELTEYQYAESGEISEIINSVFDGNITNTSTSAALSLSTVTRTFYNRFDTFWRQSISNEIPSSQVVFTGNIRRTLNINGILIEVIGCADDLFVETIETTSDSRLKNDDSTRPPTTIYSEAVKTKNKEITATINAIPIAGVPSKEKHSPLKIDWLVSDEQAYEYGKLEIVLMNGRSQCRFLLTQLTDELLALRPRCRIDIIFEGILYRCLVDAINFAQDMKRRTVGFMCDVISTSPAAIPSTVYKLYTPVNGLRCETTFDLIVEGSFFQPIDFYAVTFDMIVEAELAVDGQLEAEVTMDLIVNAVLN